VSHKIKERKVTFAVTMELPPGANLQMAQDYVKKAVQNHAGGKDPNDPMFNLRAETVTARISNVVEKTTYPTTKPRQAEPEPTTAKGKPTLKAVPSRDKD